MYRTIKKNAVLDVEHEEVALYVAGYLFVLNMVARTDSSGEQHVSIIWLFADIVSGQENGFHLFNT